MGSRGMFTGLCYLCGAHCDATYCNEHRWAEPHLCVSYRQEKRPRTMQRNQLKALQEARNRQLELETLLKSTLLQKHELEAKLHAWRTVTRNRAAA